MSHSGAHEADPRALISQPAYRLAALDPDFLLGDSMRGVRFLLEYEKADQTLRSWGIRSTIVVFGSARIREEEHRLYPEAIRAVLQASVARKEPA